MTELKELFKQREETFRTLSDQIFDSLPNVIDGCKKFVTFKGADDQLLDWEEVKYVEEHQVVVLIGSLAYKPGDTVTLPNGEKITINENTAEYFRAMLHIAIPYKLATTGSVEEVYDFLIETMDFSEADGAIVSMEEEDQKQFLADTENFNLDALTEEQRAQLNMAMASNKTGGKN